MKGALWYNVKSSWSAVSPWVNRGWGQCRGSKSIRQAVSALRMSPLVTCFIRFWGRWNFVFPCQRSTPVMVDGPAVRFEKPHLHRYSELCPGCINFSLHCSLTKNEIELLWSKVAFLVYCLNSDRGVSFTIIFIVTVTCKALWSEILHFMDQKLS